MLALSGLETPDGSEISKHPDFRTIASFFLGWVFLTAVASIFSSPLTRNFSRTLFQYFLLRHVKHRTLVIFSEKKTLDSASENDCDTIRSGDSFTLLFIMFICFVTGSVANFASLLSFGGNGALCAFAVAWGNLATQAARLMGLLVLLLTLRHLGMSRWETITFLFWLLVGLVFIFVNSALAVGVTRLKRSEPLEISLCFRKHFLPASLVTTLIYVALEIFAIVRVWYLLPPELESNNRGATLLDPRILRAGSLLVLDLLTMVPSAIDTNTLAEFIPYSIGSITVLIAFNRRVDDWEVTNRTSTPRVYPVSDFPLSPLPALHLPRPAEELIPVANYPVLPPIISYHPFATRSLEDPTPLRDEWEQHPCTARSSRTIDSVYARSIQGAVVQIARRAKPSELMLNPADVAGSSQSALVKSAPLNVDRAMKMLLKPHTYAGPVSSYPAKPARPKLMIVTHTPDGWPSRPMANHFLTRPVSRRVANERRSSLISAEVTNETTSRFSWPTTNSPCTVSYPAVIQARTSSNGDSHRTSMSSTHPESHRSATLDTTQPGELTNEAAKLWTSRSPPNSAPLTRPIALPIGPRSPERRRLRLDSDRE